MGRGLLIGQTREYEDPYTLTYDLENFMIYNCGVSPPDNVIARGGDEVYWRGSRYFRDVPIIFFPFATIKNDILSAYATQSVSLYFKVATGDENTVLDIFEGTGVTYQSGDISRIRELFNNARDGNFGTVIPSGGGWIQLSNSVITKLRQGRISFLSFARWDNDNKQIGCAPSDLKLRIECTQKKKWAFVM